MAAQQQRADKLEDQNFYHGIRTREDVAKELKVVYGSFKRMHAFQKPGDFLVRAAQSKSRTDIILNVLGENGLSNLILSIVGGSSPKYCLHSQKNAPNRLEFDSVVDLINFFRMVPLPGGIRLKHGIPRPAWLIKHSSIQYSAEDKLGSGKQIISRSD
jgi:hypothetical protein